jgi:HlyD family secretion protein
MREQLRSRIAQLGQQIGGYHAQIGALRKQQTLIDPERENMQALYKRGLVTLSRLNQLERTSVDADGSVAMLQAQIAQTRGKISETREQLLQMNQTRRSDAGTQLASLNSQLNEQTMRNISARDIKYRSLIRAPYAGVVNKISFFTLGEVVRPAEPIMEIVPDKDRMTVEVQINPTDVEQVQSGAKARVRFSSLNSTATPEVTGVVTLVAPDRTTNPQTGQSYFAARVAVDPKDIARHRELALRVGMPAEVFIETGDRSMMSYLTKPLRDQFARAFRDN